MTYYNCDGRGRCLVETFDDKTIFVKNCDFYCKYTCTPSPCANYLFCEHLVPNYILRSTKGLCTQCSYSFGHLVFSECPECPECPICFQTKTSVKQKTCDHTVCIDCFKRCHSPTYWKDPKPVFPYDSERREKYECTYYDRKWRRDPLLVKYIEDMETWETTRQLFDEEQAYLRACPLCRK